MGQGYMDSKLKGWTGIIEACLRVLVSCEMAFIYSAVPLACCKFQAVLQRNLLSLFLAQLEAMREKQFLSLSRRLPVFPSQMPRPSLSLTANPSNQPCTRIRLHARVTSGVVHTQKGPSGRIRCFLLASARRAPGDSQEST